MVMYCVFTLHCPFSAGEVPRICVLLANLPCNTPTPTTDRGGKGRCLTNKLFPQCGAFSRDLLDGMSKTPDIPGQGPCLYMTCAFLR